MKVASVTFGVGLSTRVTDRQYDYRVPDHLEDMAVDGSLAVVESPSMGYVVVTIESVKDRRDSDWDGKFKDLVDVVDDTTYVQKKVNERRAAQVREELAEAAAAAKDLEIYRKLAEVDPKVKALLEELEELLA